MSYAEMLDSMSPAEKENFVIAAISNERELKELKEKFNDLLTQFHDLEDTLGLRNRSNPDLTID